MSISHSYYGIISSRLNFRFVRFLRFLRFLRL
jgi:hypothetical protein